MSAARKVVAGVLRRDGKILICQRAASDSFPLQWEFPGGKVEAGEQEAAALQRELSEELGIDAAIGPEIERYIYAYPGKQPIELIFFAVQEFTGAIENRIFADVRWEFAESLTSYEFLAGDVEFVRRLPGLLQTRL